MRILKFRSQLTIAFFAAVNHLILMDLLVNKTLLHGFKRSWFVICGFRSVLAWVSGVSGGKGERWKRKRETAEGEKRLTQMLLLEPSTPTRHDSIPSNQNHIGWVVSFTCKKAKINLTIRSGRALVPVLLRFRFFWNLQWGVFEYL